MVVTRRNSSAVAASGDNIENEVDRISKLPDEIIHYILSFIDTKYAVKTCVLSKRWIHIWKSLPFLNFDARLYYLSGYNDYNQQSAKFKDLIDGVLYFRDVCDIQWFRLRRYEININVITSISRWIVAVIDRNVQEVTLEELECAYGAFTYKIPSKLLVSKSLEKLTLTCNGGYVVIDLPKSMSLPHLKLMSLGGIIVLDNEESITRLFSSCPLLETLSIINCDIQTNNQKNFTVESLNLKRFTYTNRHGETYNTVGYQIKPKPIMLSAPNLTRFTCIYEDQIQQLTIQEKEANAKCIVKLLLAVNKVERIDLSAGFLEVLSNATEVVNCQLPSLCNVQFLSLETRLTGGSLRTTAYILTICPNIETLILELNGPNPVDAGDDWEVGFSLPGILSQLKTLVIREMVGCDAELKLVSFLLQNSKVLDDVDLFFHPSVGLTEKVRRGKQFKKMVRALPETHSKIHMMVF